MKGRQKSEQALGRGMTVAMNRGGQAPRAPPGGKAPGRQGRAEGGPGSHMFRDQDTLTLKKQMTRRSVKNTEGCQEDKADGASDQKKHREPPMFLPSGLP